MHTLDQLETLVRAWSTERGIYEHSTPQAQALKLVSEVGELCDAVIKGDRPGLVDGIGDCLVVCANIAQMSGTDLTECFNAAYEAIKNRTGKMSNKGAWVKDD